MTRRLPLVRLASLHPAASISHSTPISHSSLACSHELSISSAASARNLTTSSPILHTCLHLTWSTYPPSPVTV
ncbi:hypothetical protein DAEQUDRAFT_724699 [Daedalea quercina L-15889]|uniref:Uncharacterized protein n=1 Tax=Daedalea quercina L-15889 TaxID=1314783 RepID=A0A165RMK3_9APHY|nr:hypothetical protein DAEQUDRAFT_724699 [Daedalea quercina L-15889]